MNYTDPGHGARNLLGQDRLTSTLAHGSIIRLHTTLRERFNAKWIVASEVIQLPILISWYPTSVTADQGRR